MGTGELTPGRVVLDNEHACIGVVEGRPHPRGYVWLNEPLNGEVLVSEVLLSPYEPPQAIDLNAAIEQSLVQHHALTLGSDS